jgi:hypothetical protein
MTQITDEEAQVLQRLARDILAGTRVSRLLLQVVKMALAGSTMALAVLHVWQWLQPHIDIHLNGGD